jgi:hypothetical protein
VARVHRRRRRAFAPNGRGRTGRRRLRWHCGGAVVDDLGAMLWSLFAVIFAPIFAKKCFEN